MDTKIKAIIAALQAQRNQAQDAVAELNGIIAELKEKIAELEKEEE